MTERKTGSIFLNGSSWPIFHGLASLFILLVLAVQLSPLAAYLETRVTAPVMFLSRHKLAKSPSISPKLKILALDDSSFAYLGGPRLSQTQLLALLQNIGRQQPRAILIDSLLSDNPEQSPQNNSYDVGHLPIFSGNYLSASDIRYRRKLDLTGATYQLGTRWQGSATLNQLPYSLDQRLGWKVYGYSPSYESMIRGTGHITYNRDGSISPFYQIDDRTLVPHLSLYSSPAVELRESGLWIEGAPVPLTQKGAVLINHRPPAEIYERAMPLHGSIKLALAGSPDSHIQKDDVVLILLAFATGNTDFHESSPFGPIPGGLLIASMISDILDHSWLRRLEMDIPLILVFGIAGIILGINARALRYWLALSTSCLLTIAFAVWLFAYHSLSLPWLLPLIAFTGTSLIHFAHTRIQEELRLILVENDYRHEKTLRLDETLRAAEYQSKIMQGHTLQHMLLPPMLEASFGDHVYSMIHKPYVDLSGNWLYLWDYSRSERRILIGDVTGHGFAAAIPMAMVLGILKDCEEQRWTLEDSLARMNRRLYEMFQQQVTCNVSALTLYDDGRIELVNAGGLGWFVAGNKEAHHHLMPSQALGLKPTIQFVKKLIELRDHDIAFTFTDGFLNERKDLRLITRHLRQQKQAPSSCSEVADLLGLTLQVAQPTTDQSLIYIRRDTRKATRVQQHLLSG